MLEIKLNEKFDCELLRPVEYINEPDPRTRGFSKTLADYHQDVSVFKLIDNVPREIAIQFETTKNLYLYGWFIYRFYTVSEHHALACLEIALRRRYGETIPKNKYYPKQKRPGLKALLRFAVDCKDIKKENFATWRRATLGKARGRYEQSKFQEMREKNLEEIELNYDEVEIGDEDKDWNYVEVLNKILPDQRNRHAHGSDELNMFHGPRHTIQIVSEVINQIYSHKP